MASNGGRHYVRGHWRNNPTPKKRSGFWVVVAVLGVVSWGLVNGASGDEESAPQAPKPSTSSSSQQ